MTVPLWLPLIVLALCVGMFSWISETVLPETWETGRQFGIEPSRFERAYRRAVQVFTVLVGAMWWLFLLALLFG